MLFTSRWSDKSLLTCVARVKAVPQPRPLIHVSAMDGNQFLHGMQALEPASLDLPRKPKPTLSGRTASKKEADTRSSSSRGSVPKKLIEQEWVDKHLARCPDHRQCGCCGVHDDDEDVLGSKPYPWGYPFDPASLFCVVFFCCLYLF